MKTAQSKILGLEQQLEKTIPARKPPQTHRSFQTPEEWNLSSKLGFFHIYNIYGQIYSDLN